MNDTETHLYFYGETSGTHSHTHTQTPLRLGHFHTDARFGAKENQVGDAMSMKLNTLKEK